jgi:F420-dependent methylenetetrahydromethanopterin dehydrogenase
VSHELQSQLDDPIMQAAPRALARAAKRAREIARQTGTPLVIVRDGVLVEEWVTDDDDHSYAASTTQPPDGASKTR